LRYRINKKVRIFMQTELQLLKDRGFAAGIGSDAAISGGVCSGTGEYCLVGRRIDNNQQTAWKNGAGSGNLVPPFGNISNPRVLSDMGLAIPRPTRLGDPRSLISLCGEDTPSFKPLQLFEDYLKAQKKRNVRQIMCYTQKYANVLQTGDASSIVAVTPALRLVLLPNSV